MEIARPILIAASTFGSTAGMELKLCEPLAYIHTARGSPTFGSIGLFHQMVESLVRSQRLKTRNRAVKMLVSDAAT
jgi:hypothetical protein